MEIRAFSMNGKKKVYGAYSSAKKVKIKKIKCNFYKNYGLSVKLSAVRSSCIFFVKFKLKYGLFCHFMRE